MSESAEVFKAETWSVLTTPGTSTYHPLWAPVLLGELVFNLLLVAGFVLAFCLFFGKRRLFPRVAISLLFAGFSMQILDLVFMQAIPMAAAEVGASDIREAMQSAIAAAIWIPYFLKSKRVAATFVE